MQKTERRHAPFVRAHIMRPQNGTQPGERKRARRPPVGTALPGGAGELSARFRAATGIGNPPAMKRSAAKPCSCHSPPADAVGADSSSAARIRAVPTGAAIGFPESWERSRTVGAQCAPRQDEGRGKRRHVGMPPYGYGGRRTGAQVK